MKVELTNHIAKAIHTLVSGFCNFPSQLNITEAESDEHLVITIVPHMADFRLIVGSKGKTIKALEWLVVRAGRKDGKKALLMLNESFVGDHIPDKTFKPNGDFDVDALKRLIASWSEMAFGKKVGMDFKSVENKLRVYLTPEQCTPEDKTTVRAMDAVFYPYGVQRGKIVEIRQGE